MADYRHETIAAREKRIKEAEENDVSIPAEIIDMEDGSESYWKVADGEYAWGTAEDAEEYSKKAAKKGTPCKLTSLTDAEAKKEGANISNTWSLPKGISDLK